MRKKLKTKFIKTVFAVTVFICFLFVFYSSTFKRVDTVCDNCNIILISIDTLRADHLSSYGYFRNTSPNIDKLANEGILFKNAFSQAPISLPSHMSIFTSLYPATHGVNNPQKDKLSNSIKTLPEILKTNGYKTAWFGPLNHDQLNLSIGFGRGFDEFYPDLYGPNEQNQAYDWIDNNYRNKFFIFLHTYRLHDPYLVPLPFDKLYDTEYKGKIIGDNNEFFEKYYETVSPVYDYGKIRAFYWQYANTSDKDDVNHLIALYDTLITCCVDTFIGKLMSKIQEHEINDRTIIILTSDHGEAFGEHGEFLHITLHNEVLHVPLIIKIPNSNGKVIESQVQSIDIMPTILDISGITTQYDIQGTSLIPLMRNKTKIINEYTYGYWHTMSSVRSDKWKLIKYSNGKLELYDIKTDQEEQVNVAERYPNVVNEMKNKLEEFELSGYK